MKECLSFKFAASNYQGWPAIKISINNCVVKDHVFSQSEETLDFYLDLPTGPGVVTIERYGKTDHNVDFRDGMIWQDQFVELKNIMVNDVALPKMFAYSGIWCWNNKREPGALKWGPNGIWQWNCAFPIVDWALKMHRQAKKPHLDLFDPVTEPVDDILRNLKLLEMLIAQHADKKNITDI